MAGQQARTGRRAGGDHDRALFEHALVGIFRSTPAGRFTAVNPALVRMLGYASAAEVLALTLPQDLYVDPAQWQALRACSEATGVLEGVEVRWKRKGGQPLTVSLYARALRDARGRVVSSEGLVLDVTARAQAEAALQESVRVQERMADILPEVLYRYDLVAHHLVYVNRQITEVLGYPPEKVTGKSATVLRKLLHPEDVARVTTCLQRWATAADGDLVETEYRVKHASGEWRWLQGRETVFTRTAAGVPHQILGTAQDITARKRLEELLQERRLHRQEVVAHLRQFRDGLGLSQSEFGQTFGGYSQRQISSYESGAAEFPLDLLLAIRAKGYPLEAVLGVGSTAVIDQTVQYLSSSHAVQFLAQQLVEALGRLLDRDAQTTKQILQELGIPATTLTRLPRDQQKLLEQLAAVAKGME